MDGFHRSQDGTEIHPPEIAGQDASLAKAAPSGGREGREGTGTVFVLTSSGLRHMGLRPSTGRPNATGRGFLGYLQEEIFWKDALELVHEDDLPLLSFLLSLVMEEPGASESVEVRFRDAWGDWVLMDVCVLNVLEAPTGHDTGLLVVNVRHPRESTFRSAGTRNGSRQPPLSLAPCFGRVPAFQHAPASGCRLSAFQLFSFSPSCLAWLRTTKYCRWRSDSMLVAILSATC